MQSPEPVDHVRETIATYDRIAPHYGLTATPEVRAWEERSMRAFRELLPGKRALVPGCGDGRDSRFLASLDLRVISFNPSGGMLSIAKAQDPAGTYVVLHLRQISIGWSIRRHLGKRLSLPLEQARVRGLHRSMSSPPPG